VFICVESEPPHDLAIYTLPAAALDVGRRLMDIALARYRDALTRGEWRGYSPKVQLLTFPSWGLQINV
jgi:hypothetical protein